MKKGVFMIIAAGTMVAFSSCKKCAECHYDKDGTEVELGEFCGDDLENREDTPYHDHSTETDYEVHCHEH